MSTARPTHTVDGTRPILGPYKRWSHVDSFFQAVAVLQTQPLQDGHLRKACWGRGQRLTPREFQLFSAAGMSRQVPKELATASGHNNSTSSSHDKFIRRHASVQSIRVEEPASQTSSNCSVRSSGHTVREVG